MLALVKVVVDGVVSALHTHDGSHLKVVSERLARRLGASPTDVADMLSVNGAGVLGERRLLWPFRDFVQWNPADDAIVHLRVAASPSATWGLTGRLGATEYGVSRSSLTLLAVMSSACSVGCLTEGDQHVHEHQRHRRPRP